MKICGKKIAFQTIKKLSFIKKHQRLVKICKICVLLIFDIAINKEFVNLCDSFVKLCDIHQKNTVFQTIKALRFLKPHA